MEYDRELGRRLLVGGFVVALLGVAAYIALAFLAVVVFAVFLYYAVRPIYRNLARFDLPRRLRAILALVLFGVPFAVLLVYTVAIIIVEAQTILETYDVQDQFLETIITEGDLTGLDTDELRELLAEAGTQASLGLVIVSLGSVVDILSGFLVQFLITLVLTYYMLIDGPRFVSWLLETFDESGVARAYVRAVDPELSMTLFGNIVNVFVTAIVGVVTFYSYNAVAPAVVEVPFPALVGALAGIGSLIPVVGIKLVYIPVVIGLTATAWFQGDLSLLVPVAVLLVVSAVVVDFIPDFFIRAHISGDQTHTGLLLVAYIVGPAVFGLYGLFLAPIVLILVINAVSILLPYALSGSSPETRQRTLEEFTAEGTSDDTRVGEPVPGKR